MAKANTARKPRKLAPRTAPADPEASSHRGILVMPQRSAGVIVNEDTAMSQSAVWACIRCISESLAGMPWRIGKLAKDGTIDAVERKDIDWLLNYEANEETRSFAFRETLWAWALGWGNGYAEIERNLLGEPVALWQLHPSRVTPMRDGSDNLVYEVTNDGAPPSYIPPRNMFHLMGPSPDGLVGWSVIRMHARTIGLAIAQEDNASSFNANDSTPGGLLKHPGKLSDGARKNLEESWNRRHRGPNNRRTVAILEEAMDWQQTGMSPDDAKLVEQMQLTPAMICRIFRVPPHKIADLTRSTNNNIEHQDLEFVKDTLRPWSERGEGAATPRPRQTTLSECCLRASIRSTKGGGTWACRRLDLKAIGGSSSPP
jgi:HK97 family phage portal protein